MSTKPRHACLEVKNRKGRHRRAQRAGCKGNCRVEIAIRTIGENPKVPQVEPPDRPAAFIAHVAFPRGDREQ
jgi:hypothetical protein